MNYVTNIGLIHVSQVLNHVLLKLIVKNDSRHAFFQGVCHTRKCMYYTIIVNDDGVLTIQILNDDVDLDNPK